VHRSTDPRSCGATTVVAGNTSVYANNLLVSVNGDPNSHGGGALIASSNSVFVNNILSVNHGPDSSAPDSLCPSSGGAHCSPVTAGGSPNVFTGG
jgi:hypothetical protein